MADVLQAHRVSLYAGERLLLDDVTLSLRPGEVVALIGPNGAGKSTLLRVLTGFQLPDGGSVSLADRPLDEWPNEALARQRAVMRQRSGMAFSWTVEEVIAMGRAPWPENDTQSIVSEVMALTGCDSLAGRDFCQLSGGEQQRVQLARALAQLWHNGQPHGWLFLDEPTSALDLYHQQHILRLLRRLALMGRLSVCIVLHDLNLAALWADRIILLHGGKLVAQGSPQQVLNESTLTQWYQAELKVFSHPEHPVPQVWLQP
ncbi:heme ABC transporter ATP-binding protein [Enterobacteriaceae bacterium H20N1]|uniref:Heme ABC transporter ATP-binding protein n=1 Tax=Dryocola boscaweniae TaxID=2925397 RepID=A0A9X3APE3_9ENTR|nr:heme ABC transporter ATP-binding protein [Dryocola boscaweniae]MCT4704077.1 heme ABC transporter ATP-binding protein [Dryocola boscaweniae]MCT4717260.1 heme ABC transporter ATP-binding protein [Dryocola boscaweniae]MCT4721245.1 heme ABC transporter ATP-binding protein [Dryocola boscaweniae]